MIEVTMTFWFRIILVKEHQLAISAVDEALQLTAGLLNGNVALAETVKQG
jgi:hypothetical protein